MTIDQADSRNQHENTNPSGGNRTIPQRPTHLQTGRTGPSPSLAPTSLTIPPRFITGSQPSLAEVLARREARVCCIQNLRQTHETVVCFKLNIPGPVKNNASIRDLFAKGLKDIQLTLIALANAQACPDVSARTEHFTDSSLPDRNVERDCIDTSAARRQLPTSYLQGQDMEQALPDLPTGPEYFLTSSLPAREVKRLMVGLEETPLGRLYDIDVFGPDGPISRQDLGLPARACFLCNRPAPECARSRRHSLAELLTWVDQQINLYL